MKTPIEFCCGGKRCPVVTPTEFGIIIGGKDEGYTHFGKDQFKDFVEAAKSGKFDSIIK